MCVCMHESAGCVVSVSGCLGLAPITHRKQALALSFTLSTQETHTGNRVSAPRARFTHSSILLSSSPHPSTGPVARLQLQQRVLFLFFVYSPALRFDLCSSRNKNNYLWLLLAILKHHVSLTSNLEKPRLQP